MQSDGVVRAWIRHAGQAMRRADRPLNFEVAAEPRSPAHVESVQSTHAHVCTSPTEVSTRSSPSPAGTTRPATACWTRRRPATPCTRGFPHARLRPRGQRRGRAARLLRHRRVRPHRHRRAPGHANAPDRPPRAPALTWPSTAPAKTSTKTPTKTSTKAPAIHLHPKHGQQGGFGGGRCGGGFGGGRFGGGGGGGGRRFRRRPPTALSI